jgi:cyclophilin family peptidyl-prolyl cis-trans isomerase
VGTEKRQRQKANRQLRYQQEAKQASRRKLTKRIVIGGVVAVALLLFVLALAWFANRGSNNNDATNPTLASIPPSTLPGGSAPPAAAAPTTASATPAAFTYGTGECPPDPVQAPVKTFTAAPKQCIDPTKTYTATIVTDHGDIVVKLDTAKTPGTVNNFVVLSKYGYYDGTKIFRTDQSIDIIQGGGLTNSDKFGYTIPDEGSGYTYPEGKIAMANTGQPNSGGAQWFITAGDKAKALDDAPGTYTVFGDVVQGQDVAEKILALATSPTNDTPKETVTVQKVEITES